MPPLDITSENPYSLLPQSLNSLIGQSVAKENLRIRIEAAKKRAEELKKKEEEEDDMFKMNFRDESGATVKEQKENY